jgi:hypothetical protein
VAEHRGKELTETCDIQHFNGTQADIQDKTYEETMSAPLAGGRVTKDCEKKAECIRWT